MGSTWMKFQPHLLPISSTLSTCSLHVHTHADTHTHTHTRACTRTAVLPRPHLMFLASKGLFGDTMLKWQKKQGWPSALALGPTLSLGRMFMLPDQSPGLAELQHSATPSEPGITPSLGVLCTFRSSCWEMRVEGRTDAIPRILLGNRGICGINTPLFSSSSSHKSPVLERRVDLTSCKLSLDPTTCGGQHFYPEGIQKKAFPSTRT